VITIAPALLALGCSSDGGTTVPDGWIKLDSGSKQDGAIPGGDGPPATDGPPVMQDYGAEGDGPPVQQDQGTVQQDQGSVQQDQGSVQQDQGSVQQDQGSVQQDQGTVQQDQGTVQQDQGGTTQNLTNLFFLHHSTGEGIVVQGNMRGTINAYNSQHGTSFAFWDHEYNNQGLRDPSGQLTGTDYAIPGDNTDPDGLHLLWTSQQSAWKSARNKILGNHEVIAFKSCFPASAIASATELNQRKTWYLAMRNFFDTRKDKLFVVISTPPLHRLATNTTQASNARAFANWLCSSTYLSGHPNVVCFDLFDKLAHPDDGSAAANRLKYSYEDDHNSSDSHPNLLANQTVGPIFATFLINAALSY
jgi:hypothetical protein